MDIKPDSDIIHAIFFFYKNQQILAEPRWPSIFLKLFLFLSCQLYTSALS